MTTAPPALRCVVVLFFFVKNGCVSCCGGLDAAHVCSSSVSLAPHPKSSFPSLWPKSLCTATVKCPAHGGHRGRRKPAAGVCTCGDCGLDRSYLPGMRKHLRRWARSACSVSGGWQTEDSPLLIASDHCSPPRQGRQLLVGKYGAGVGQRPYGAVPEGM